MLFYRNFLPALWPILCSAFAALHAPHAHATAADFPTQPIKLVVYQPGGANDVVARVLADRMSTTIGQPAIVLNKPGAPIRSGCRPPAAIDFEPRDKSNSASKDLGVTVVANPPDVFAANLRRDGAKWKKTITDAAIRMD